jgi:hypothetical protein
VPAPEAPWFPGEPGQFLVYRVNRRPMWEDTLLPGAMPEDAFEHFLRVLAPGHEVITGKAHQRIWRVGGLVDDREDRTLVGRLGWEPLGQDTVPQWSSEDKDWLSATTPPHGGRIVPFGFDGETRLLTVLRDPKNKPSTVAGVFEQILRENEDELPEPTTEWSVEPVLDAQDFLGWLKMQDVVTEVSFTAKLPNPESRDAFRDLAARMDVRRATAFTETMRSKREEGLIGVEQDRDIRQAIAMGEHGFATLRGEGVRHGSGTYYSQSSRVAQERVDELPENWEGAWSLIKSLLKGRLRRFIEDA